MKRTTDELLSDHEIDGLKVEWPKLDQYTRGDRIADLARRGYSTRELGRVLGCWPKNVRNLKDLALVPKPERSRPEGAGTKKILG